MTDDDEVKSVTRKCNVCPAGGCTLVSIEYVTFDIYDPVVNCPCGYDDCEWVIQ